MSFIIESEISKQYLREENAIEGFREAVENGQVRLALQILVDIVEVFGEIFEALTEEDGENQIQNTEKAEQPKPEPQLEQEEKIAEKPEPAAKKVAKTEKADTQEV